MNMSYYGAVVDCLQVAAATDVLNLYTFSQLLRYFFVPIGDNGDW